MTSNKDSGFSQEAVDNLVKAVNDLRSVSVVEDTSVTGVDRTPDHVEILLRRTPGQDEIWNGQKAYILQEAYEDPLLKNSLSIGEKNLYLKERERRGQRPMVVADFIMVRGTDDTLYALTKLLARAKSVRIDTRGIRRLSIRVHRDTPDDAAPEVTVEPFTPRTRVGPGTRQRTER